MDLKISHTFHEVNYMPDRLVNLGLQCFAYTWWDNPPCEISKFVSNDDRLMVRGLDQREGDREV